MRSRAPSLAEAVLAETNVEASALTKQLSLQLARKLTKQPSSNELVVSAAATTKPESKSEPAKALMTQEKRQTGSVGVDIYWFYLNASNSALLAILLILMVICAQVIVIFVNMWMSWWTSDTFKKSTMFVFWRATLTMSSSHCFLLCAGGTLQSTDR